MYEFNLDITGGYTKIVLFLVNLGIISVLYVYVLLATDQPVALKVL